MFDRPDSNLNMLRQPAALAAKKRAEKEEEWERLQEERAKLAAEIEDKEARGNDGGKGSLFTADRNVACLPCSAVCFFVYSLAVCKELRGDERRIAGGREMTHTEVFVYLCWYFWS